MAYRHLEKTDSVVEQIKKLIPSADFTAEKLRLSWLESVRQFMDQINQDKILDLSSII